MSEESDVGFFFIGLGVALLFYILFRFLKSLYNILFPYLIFSPINLRNRAGAKWAVVTGATDGIGKAYAFELAKRGFDILLISRTQSKLLATRQEILDEVENVEVDIYAFDFSTGSSEEYETLSQYLETKEIGVLINNVGGISDYPEILHKLPGGINSIGEIVMINVLPPTLLCASVLSQMSVRKAGIIVNIASGAATMKMKEWSIYSASKKYVTWLTSILQKEYEPYGITIQSICPMLVATKLSKVDTPSLFGPDAPTFVKQAVRTIGLVRETSGYITHQIEQELLKLIPEFLMDRGLAMKSKEMRDAFLGRKQ